MAILYSYILRQAGIRIGAYKGTAPQIATNYPTISNIQSANFPLPALKDSLRLTEEEIATAVASNREHVWRRVMQDVTANIASGGVIPLVGSSAATNKIIGVYGTVCDASNQKILTPGLTEDEIRAITENVNSYLHLNYYSYAISPPRIYHTRTNVTIDVCVYDADAQATAIENDTAVLFPEAEGAYLAGLMSKLKNEDEKFTVLSNEYAPEYLQWLAAFQAGRTYIGEQPKAPA